ncbi:acyl-CoA dehydrogenase, partial [Mycobacterium kansasii]
FDLKAQGVTVRPIVQLGGDTGFGEIFLDDVFVPDDDVIGTPNDGWRAAMSTSSNERGMSLRSPGRFLAAADRLVRLWK